MFNERGCQAKPGALVVLNFRPNLRLAVLIELVLIKKACIQNENIKTCLGL